jgi:cyclase
MPAARIIPCLDVAGGRVVKGIRFRDHRDMGSILDLAQRYRDQGADELVFYDIEASVDGRSVDRAWINELSQLLDIPFCVAGGIRSLATAERCLAAGADKISVNSPALERPELIEELARAFGSQCVVVGIDSEEVGGEWQVRSYTGRPDAMRDARRRTLEWAKEATDRGAGEIVLTAMNHDGVGKGYAITQLEALIAEVSVPIIASGGAGKPEDFAQAFRARASGALAATVFHEGRIAIPELKRFLAAQGIEVRP